eukprot:CAMPEP_0118938162 /NCGR_PEP_ID=MMETSP1169-20130426/24946_1 /TAXON_ID=36882 /ORGANISM="Pyramimonas obovata, Strain CCMP722" /LENGTH=359 /DNA_ID=CAMNT_0006882019 /DNA_START=305 /DNA_END=1381 /DNA_ORIENTATION=-
MEFVETALSSSDQIREILSGYRATLVGEMSRALTWWHMIDGRCDAPTLLILGVAVVLACDARILLRKVLQARTAVEQSVAPETRINQKDLGERNCPSFVPAEEEDACSKEQQRGCTPVSTSDRFAAIQAKDTASESELATHPNRTVDPSNSELFRSSGTDEPSKHSSQASLGACDSPSEGVGISTEQAKVEPPTPRSKHSESNSSVRLASTRSVNGSTVSLNGAVRDIQDKTLDNSREKLDRVDTALSPSHQTEVPGASSTTQQNRTISPPESPRSGTVGTSERIIEFYPSVDSDEEDRASFSKRGCFCRRRKKKTSKAASRLDSPKASTAGSPPRSPAISTTTTLSATPPVPAQAKSP